MAIEYERTTYRTCEGLGNLRFTKCELSKTHVPKQLGTIKQIVIPNRNDGNYYGLSTEPRYLGVWERTSSGEEVHLGNSKNAIIQATSTLSIFEFDGIPNNGNGLILGLLVDANGDSLDELAPDDIGGRGNAGDSDGCILYTRAENANYTHLPDITFTIEYQVEVPDVEPDEPTPDDPDNPDNPDTPDDPTPDEEENLREVRIEEYWPLIVKNTAEFDQIAVAENPEFNNFLKCIYRALKDGFILEATEYGVERWEKMLGISPAAGSSLDDRKAAILNYLSVKTPYTWRVLKQMLVGILGEDKFVMEYINDEGKLVLHTDRVSDEILGTISDMLKRVLPMNIEVARYNHRIDVDWRDYPLPRNYTAIEWIEGEKRNAIYTDFCPSSNTEVHFDFVHLSELTWESFGILFGNAGMGQPDAFSLAMYNGGHLSFDFGGQRFDPPKSSPTNNERHYLKINRHEILIDGVLIGEPHEVTEFKSTKRMAILTVSVTGKNGGHFQIYEGKFLDEGVLHCHFLPALDETGAPCLFDIVGRKAYYNEGEGDLIFPTESTTYSLRRVLPDWGKLTEHGLRRLYHAPANYKGELYDYAVENGYKPIIEEPAPEEGYWTPQWRETEDEIVLDWIETEPPMEVNENE